MIKNESSGIKQQSVKIGNYDMKAKVVAEKLKGKKISKLLSGQKKS